MSALDGVLSVVDVLGVGSAGVHRDANGMTYTVKVRGEPLSSSKFTLDTPLVNVENGFYAGQKELRRSVGSMYGITNKRLQEHGFVSPVVEKINPLGAVHSKRVESVTRTKYHPVRGTGRRRSASKDADRITIVQVKPVSHDKRNAEPLLRALGLGALGTSATLMDGPFIRSLLPGIADFVKVERAGK